MLGAHDIIGTTIGLAGNNSDLRDSGLRVGVQELGSVTDNTVVLLGSTRQETGDIDQGQNWNVECISKTDKTGSLDGRVDIKNSGRDQGLVGNDRDSATTHATETNDNVLGIVGHDFKELRVIDQAGNDILDIVGLGRVDGDDLVQRGILTGRGIVGVTNGGGLLVGKGQEVDKVTKALQSFDIVLEGVVGDTRLDGVGLGSSELLLGDLLLGDGLNDIGTSDEKVGSITDHEGEIGQSRRVDGASSTGSHNQRDLRNNSRRHDVFLLGVYNEHGRVGKDWTKCM